MGDDASARHISELKPPRTRSSSLIFIQNRLRRLGTGSSVSASLSVTDVKGPLGLSLLHEPSEPRIDFIFVHGLGGGSRKTWSHSAEHGLFWPRDWLPNEIGFRHVRLHSFGYNSDWTSRKESRLTVHDFGQALLADLYNAPSIRASGDTPIVLVAHSMGGLVAKKAYLLATRDSTYKTIAQRIHTMYFLGTPHRGADSAQVAKLLIASTSLGTKSFVDELLPGSGSLDQINDEFRHVCGNLKLWSFFEGTPTDFGVRSSLVVDKNSAILGLPHEHTQFLQADHRHICKFASPNDPNYVILQRAFVTTIEDMQADNRFQRQDEYRSHMKSIASLLGVDQRPDADLLAIGGKQHHGSCLWLTGDPVFLDWVESASDSELSYPSGKAQGMQESKILWLTGRPGTGKSVASGHVIKYLEACNFDCSFYFFKHQDKTRSTVSQLLRSLAFQMAESSVDVRRKLVSMIEDDERVSKDDHHMLWSKLFMNHIFKVENLRPQFWIIDAADECASKGLAAMVSMLSIIDPRIPVRIFLTSRPGGQLERLLAQEGTRFTEMNTGGQGSLSDIQLFLKARCPQIGDTGSSQELVADILSKSNGIFLWASLTVTRLEDIFTIEDMQEVLRQTPSEMNEFYGRITDSIAASPNSELATCILKWSICSPWPLRTQEVEEAVRLDIGRTLTASSSQLEAMCGHLISVDSQSRIHISHQTISAFLTQTKTALWIDRPLSHARLAEICLNLLCGKDFSPPRTRRVDTASKGNRSPLADYAAASFAHHLMHCSASADTPLLVLDKFIRSNGLTWIEKTSRTGDLFVLRQTAQRLKAYLGRRSKYHPPIGSEFQNVEAWIIDLSHIVAAFGPNLLTFPASVYFMIPHICPKKSLTHRLFAKPTRRLSISGCLDEDWHDRLTCYLFPVEASSIACSDRLIAVGLDDGDIRLYNSNTLDLVVTLDHGKKVRNLAFNQTYSLLASCSARKLTVWDVRRASSNKWSPIWSQNLDFTSSEIAFSSDGSLLRLANPQGSALSTFAVRNGVREAETRLHASADSESSDGDGHKLTRWTPSERIRLDPSHRLAAISYRNATVAVWDVEAVEEIGNFEKEGFEDVYNSPQTLDILFNPMAELELLVITYKDGDLATCNPWTLEQVCEYHSPVILAVLGATSDGRILAGGDEDGSIHLFLFETLQPIYHIERPEEQLRIHNLAFSSDNLRFFDIRGQCCNVWEPFVLVPKDGSDDSSSEPQSEEIISREPTGSAAQIFQWGNAITVMTQTASGTVLFTGRQNGTIDLYELSSGTVIDKLRVHGSFSEICFLDWNEERGLLLSVDTTNRCVLTVISFTGWGGKPQMEVILDLRESRPIRQALLSPDGLALLMAGDCETKLLTTSGSLIRAETTYMHGFWVNHTYDDAYVILLGNTHMHMFDWSSLQRRSPPNGILITSSAYTSCDHDTLWASRNGSNYLVRGFSSQLTSHLSFAALDISKATPDSKGIALSVCHGVGADAKVMVGILKSTLFFLDPTGWVCSVNLKGLEDATCYTRHFFIPLTWQTGTNLVVKVVSKNTVAFARGEHIVVFQGFLDFEEKVPFDLRKALALRPATS
ncbi:hypothetical protein BJ170DRAFT_611830 [Xylariales sp. AK1849]|nr:hypothetical protein BJ170DRAFT_611830 [Xylariales sp. AK1849]